MGHRSIMEAQEKQRFMEDSLWHYLNQEGVQLSPNHFCPRQLYKVFEEKIAFVEVKRRFPSCDMVIGYLLHCLGQDFWRTWTPVSFEETLMPLEEGVINKETYDQVFDGGMHLFSLIESQKKAIEKMWTYWPTHWSLWSVLYDQGTKNARLLEKCINIPFLYAMITMGAWISCIPSFISSNDEELLAYWDQRLRDAFSIMDQSRFLQYFFKKI
jgi:hypothetical protein